MNSELRRTLCLALAMLAALPGCAAFEPKADAAATARYSKTARAALELGRREAPRDPGFVNLSRDLLFAQGLREFYAPFAGAQRLLALERQHAEHPLIPLFLQRDELGRRFSFEDEDDFRSGNYFNFYDARLFDPFYRNVLLIWVARRDWDDASFEPLAAALKESIRLSPRFGEAFPIDLAPETRDAFEGYLKRWPDGPLADRFRFHLLVSRRSRAWAGELPALDERLNQIKAGTRDELLKMDIDALLDQERTDPGAAFLGSLALPGLGQARNGDAFGAVLMAALAGAVWWWGGSRLAASGRTEDPAARQAAYGDAALSLPLILAAHWFAASSASTQAVYANTAQAWDALVKTKF